MKNIIASVDKEAGLCNRIKCLISAMHVSKQLNSGLLIDWKPSFSCGAKFSDLFDNDIKEADETQLKSEDNKIVSTWNLPYNSNFKFNEIPQETRKIILECINKLQIKREITGKANDFLKSKQFSPVNAVGVHARRNEFLLNKAKKTSTDDLFFKRMDEMIKQNPEVYFFLATDSKKTEQKFIERYGKRRIIVYPKINLDRIKPETVKEAFVELLILSKFKYLLGSYLSTFTEMAWWLGGCKAEVEIMGDKKILLVGRNIKTSRLSSINQYLRTNSAIYREIMRKIGYWG